MENGPLVSVIIPHYNGREILLRCLAALKLSRDVVMEIILVDNASTDGSIGQVREKYPTVRVVRSDENLGFAGGCNLGMQQARGRYFLLLNNDAVVTEQTIAQLAAYAEQNPEYAALQPKVCSLSNEGWFDYAGAAGGMMDIFGFPFARGRIFHTIEEDYGQYDQDVDLFWASGTCTLLRRSAVEETGMLDESFFAHMEEIDLNWRLLIAGYKVGLVSQAVVYHDAGSTLKQNSPQKIYLNHRNNLIMLLKNYSWPTLAMIFPLRLLMEFAAGLYAVVQRDWPQARAILRALVHVAMRAPAVLPARRDIARFRKRTDSEVMAFMYRNSMVVQYFLFRKKIYSAISTQERFAQ